MVFITLLSSKKKKKIKSKKEKKIVTKNLKKKIVIEPPLHITRVFGTQVLLKMAPRTRVS